MKTLVTGGCGFIGSHIVDALVARGDSVHVIDAECANNDVFYKNPGATYTKDNILNFEMLKRSFAGIEVVFHLAAESRIGPTIENPRDACQTNFVGTCNVLQAARDCGVKAVVYSSTSAFYGLKNTPPLHEEMRSDNLNAYSSSKIGGEDLCMMFAKLYKLPTIALRYFNVFGERMPSRGQYAPVLAIFIRQVENGEPITVVGDGSQRRDFVYVGDIAQANLLAASAAQKFPGSIYNVGSDTNNSVLEIAEVFGREIKFLPPRLGEAKSTLADITKIRTQLGFEPKTEVIKWLKAELIKRGIAGKSK